MNSQNDIKVFLLNSPSIVSSHTKYTVHHGIAPIGLAYIAGALKKNNIPFKLLDAVGENLKRHVRYNNEKDLYLRGISDEEVINAIPASVKYIGIGSMYIVDWLHVRQLIKKIRNKFPMVTIVIGGESATSFWPKILEFETNIDFVIVGEGDEIFPELIQTLENNGDISTISGLAFRQESGIPKLNARRARIKNLDDFKPDWEQFPLQNYFDEKTMVRSIGKSSMPIVASRGCVYKCSFCTSENKWGTTFVTRPVESVVAEFREYYEKYKIEHICIVDLAASIDSKWFMSLVKALAKEALPISWELSSGTRSEFLTKENLILMLKSNFTYLTLAPDSGSKKTLEMISKKLNVEEFERALKDVIAVKMRVKTNFIVGMEGQTNEQIWETYRAAIKYAWQGVDDIAIYPYVPYPGSKMFDQMVSKGTIKLDTREDYEDFIKKACTFSIVAVNNPNLEYNASLTGIHIYMMILCFIISLFIRPSRFFVLIKRLLTRKAVGVFEVAIYQFYDWNLIMAKLFISELFKKSIQRFQLKITTPNNHLRTICQRPLRQIGDPNGRDTFIDPN